MAQLGEPIPDLVTEIRGKLATLAAEHNYEVVDADAFTTGGDFLLNIWQLAISVPVGLAIVHEGISPRTVANIFYELGWMQAYGKETLVIRAGDAAMPSDFARTQYVPYDGHFQRRIRSFLERWASRRSFTRRCPHRSKTILSWPSTISDERIY